MNKAHFPIKDKFNRVFKNDIELGWFSISHHFVSDKYHRRKFYGKWFCISIKGAKVFRLLKFTPNLKFDGDIKEIVIDWQGFVELNTYNADLEDGEMLLTIRPAKWHEKIYANLIHPDQAVRAAYKLGIVSLVLGIISLLK